jgi:hypothetical protein
VDGGPDQTERGGITLFLNSFYKQGGGLGHPLLLLEEYGLKRTEGHGFSRVPMSLRLTQGDENALNFS